jgi:hypothetical protein
MSDEVELRTAAQIVFDEMSARQLSEIVRALARDRGVQAAAVTVSGDEDRDAIRIVVCAPLAGSEAEFGVAVAKAVVAEMNKTLGEDTADRDAWRAASIEGKRQRDAYFTAASAMANTLMAMVAVIVDHDADDDDCGLTNAHLAAWQDQARAVLAVFEKAKGAA